MKITTAEELLQDTGEYMNHEQLMFFKQLLQTLKQDTSHEIQEMITEIKNNNKEMSSGDEADVSLNESELFRLARTRDRKEKYMRKIDHALKKIESGEYGYCEETGEEIGLQRLLFRPVTQYCIEVQNRIDRDSKDTEFSEKQKELLAVDDISIKNIINNKDEE